MRNYQHKNLILNTYKKYFSLTVNTSVPNKMRVVLQKRIGDASTLYIGQTDTPVKYN